MKRVRMTQVFFLFVFLSLNTFAEEKPNWTDSKIVPRQTQIKAVHITELRALIDSKRFDCGLNFSGWEDAFLAPRFSTIKKVHLDQLRQAVTELSMKEQELKGIVSPIAPQFTDANIEAKKTLIRAEHINELRDFVEKVNCPKTNK